MAHDENIARTQTPQAVRAAWRASGVEVSFTLGELLEMSRARSGTAQLIAASTQRPATLTLYEVSSRAFRLAEGLRRRGVRRGDVVAVQLPNWAEAVIAHAAIGWMGAVVLPVVHIYGQSELAYLLSHSGAKGLITAGEWRGVDYGVRGAAARDGSPVALHVVVGHTAATDITPWGVLFGDAPSHPRAAVSCDDVALIVYTSGTTARPKAVRHSHTSLASELFANEGYGDGEGIALSPWPPGHIAGFGTLLRFWGLGRSSILMDHWDPHEAARLVERYGVSSTSGTPFHLGSLLDAAEACDLSMVSLSDYLAGATMIPPALIERCARRGLRTYRAYGLSEHPTISRGRPEDPLSKRVATDGRLCPGVEVRILNEQDDDVAAGDDGEIVSRGPDRFVGYGDAAEDARAFLPGGWFRTGDIGRIDEDGFLAITDRKKDIIIRGGENISSREVEDALSTMPGVLEAAVVGYPDVLLGERICAFIRCAGSQAASLEAVQAAFAALGLARQKTPERIVTVDELPRTAAGKVKKQELRRQLAAEPAAAE